MDIKCLILFYRTINNHGINSIFREYSFCFPSDLSSIIKDNNEDGSTQDTSLQLFIPVNDVSIEFTNVKTNTAPQPGSADLTNKLERSNQKMILSKKNLLNRQRFLSQIIKVTLLLLLPQQLLQMLVLKPNPITINKPLNSPIGNIPKSPERICPVCPCK